MITDVGEGLRYHQQRLIIRWEKREICNNETKDIIRCWMLQNSGAEDRAVDSLSEYITVFVCAAVTGQISLFAHAVEFCSPFRFTWKKEKKNRFEFVPHKTNMS